MDYNKIGPFLKDLRLSKNMSQYDLAEQMHVDHSKINRLENNKRRPTFDDLIYYSKIFDIYLDELTACKRKNKQNEKKLQNSLFKYLQNQNSKFKKARFIAILLAIFVVISFIGLIILYFFQNYDTMKIYTFSGSSPSYELTNGLLVLSKEKIYFQIGSIAPEVENIKIFIETNKERRLVYDGEYQVLIQDNYGYESFISYNDFISGNQKIFVRIGNEEIPLNFIEEVSNNNFVYVEEKEIGKEQEMKKFETPIKIKETFQCDENDNCVLKTDDFLLTYNSGLFFVNNKEENYTYNLNLNVFSYFNLKTLTNFEVVDNQVNCIEGNCENVEKIYNEFYKNYVEKYLKSV